jgi:hypothetical protein
MTTSRLIFGPDLEPIESESRRGAHSPGPRRDSLTVAGSSSDVVAKLVDAVSGTAGWCELQEVLPDDRRRTVHVNAHAVRWVVDDADAGD